MAIPNRMNVTGRGDAAVLSLLTARQAECLAAWTFDGLGIRRIGRLLGLSRITVRQHIIAARAKLKSAGVTCVCKGTQQRAVRFQLRHADQW